MIFHHHVQKGLGLIPVPCILKMKLVPPSLPRSSYVSSSKSEKEKARTPIVLLAEGSLERTDAFYYLQYIFIFYFGDRISHTMTEA